jgi:hypothetical protein
MILFLLMSKNILSKKICVALMAMGFFGVSGVDGGSPGISQLEFRVALGGKGPPLIFQLFRDKLPMNRSARSGSRLALRRSISDAVADVAGWVSDLSERVFDLLSAALTSFGFVFPSESVFGVFLGGGAASGPFSKALAQLSHDVVAAQVGRRGHPLADRATYWLFFVVAVVCSGM